MSIQATVTHQDKGYTDTTYTNYSNEIQTNIIANHPPTINVTDSELIIGDTFNPLENVTATDAEDGDLTEAVTVTENNVDMEVPGTYYVRYSVTDSDGNTVTAQMNVHVKSQDPPVITGTNPVRLNPNSEFNPMSTVNATDREDGDLTNRIRITSNDVATTIPGTYHVTYEVTDSDQMTATWTQTVVVTEAPIITGETAITINLHDTFDPMATVHATDKEDGDLTNQIVLTGTLDSDQSGNYDLTYTVTDSDGNTTTLRQTVTVFDNTIFQFNEAPEDLLFETTEIRSEDITINRQNPDWNIQVKDTRNNGSPWTLTATVNGAFSDQEDPNAKQLHNAITYTDDTEETVLLDNQAFVIHEGISNQNEITTIRAPANQGLRMKVNPTGVKANHDYKTSITWTLNDTP
ncbi:immunoglobulin-like domain-containing protein [Listeria riparia]|uniref:Putative peptidoglycan linked protein n=1 Tax=Listeria riparia FSL S10-1204 TaxID=1265816 RepID=W7D3E0_9LIST|nr:immunoglobulin-like domain-containing protein [Listeria riparia]EUJ42391.1 putative peptidoglycan linked protein [Listeria riparia FSL S10-1204]